MVSITAKFQWMESNDPIGSAAAVAFKKYYLKKEMDKEFYTRPNWEIDTRCNAILPDLFKRSIISYGAYWNAILNRVFIWKTALHQPAGFAYFKLSVQLDQQAVAL